jgi:hypothetical protein
MPLIECIPNVSGRGPKSSRWPNDQFDARCSPARPFIGSGAQPLGIRWSGMRRVSRPLCCTVQTALASVDLRTHQGEHPRLGAVDVVPLVPIEGVTMATAWRCAESRRNRRRAVRRSIYLYEEASSIRPARI